MLPSTVIRLTAGITDQGWSAKDWYDEKGAYQKIQQYLSGNTNNMLNSMLCDRRTALQDAALFGFPAIIQLLLEYGAWKDYQCVASKNSIGYDGYFGGETALFFACHQGNISCVKILIEHGANPNLADYHNNTPFHVAISSGYYVIANYLSSVKNIDLDTSLNRYSSRVDRSPIQTLLTNALNPMLFESHSWHKIHRYSAAIIRRMLLDGVRINYFLVDNLVSRLSWDHFNDTSLNNTPPKLDDLSHQSELFYILLQASQNWCPPQHLDPIGNHYTFSKTDQKNISTFLLLHNRNGVSRLHSDIWGIIYSFIIPRFPVSSYLYFSTKIKNSE